MPLAQVGEEGGEAELPVDVRGRFVLPEVVVVRLVDALGDRHPLREVRATGGVFAEPLWREAVAAYAGSNGLDPTAFPSLLSMENELLRAKMERVPGPLARRRRR